MDRRQRFFLRLSVTFGAMLAIASLGARAQIGGVDLLPPSEAFRLEVSRPTAERLRVSWTIAEGYYLYRHRFGFEAAPAKLRDGINLPPGIPKQDPFFGDTEIYRHQIAFELALEKSAATLDRVGLRVVSQGCADIGICFPPEARHVDLAVGETAVPKAGIPFAPIAKKKPADLIFPSSPDGSQQPKSGSSP